MYKEWMYKVIDTIYKKDYPVCIANWHYEDGVLLKGMTYAYELDGNEKYYEFIENYLTNYIREDGDVPRITKRPKSVDSLHNGKIIVAAYKHTKRACYERPIEIILEAIKTHPRLDNCKSFAHKVIYDNQIWLDGLFMLQPLYAELAQMYDMKDAWDDIAAQYENVTKFCYDTDKQLYYHAYDHKKQMFWANKETGLSPHFWGRALGWLAMSTVETLDFFPEDHPGREAILDCVKKIAAGITKYQSPEGVWYQILDLAHREGNYKESSCTTMFAYFLKKAIMKGYIGKEYEPYAKKAIDGLFEEFVTVDENDMVHVHQCCLVAGLGPNKRPERDGSFEYYISEQIVDDDNKTFGTLLCLLTLYAAEEMQ